MGRSLRTELYMWTAAGFNIELQTFQVLKGNSLQPGRPLQTFLTLNVSFRKSSLE